MGIQGQIQELDEGSNSGLGFRVKFKVKQISRTAVKKENLRQWIFFKK
jgi:hypothetical protein